MFLRIILNEMGSGTVDNTRTANSVNADVQEARKKGRKIDRKEERERKKERKKTDTAKFNSMQGTTFDKMIGRKVPRSATPTRRDTDLLSAQELSNGKRCDVTITSP
jgi:hypothetical protein